MESALSSVSQICFSPLDCDKCLYSLHSNSLPQLAFFQDFFYTLIVHLIQYSRFHYCTLAFLFINHAWFFQEPKSGWLSLFL